MELICVLKYPRCSTRVRSSAATRRIPERKGGDLWCERACATGRIGRETRRRFPHCVEVGAKVSDAQGESICSMGKGRCLRFPDFVRRTQFPASVSKHPELRRDRTQLRTEAHQPRRILPVRQPTEAALAGSCSPGGLTVSAPPGLSGQRMTKPQENHSGRVPWALFPNWTPRASTLRLTVSQGSRWSRRRVDLYRDARRKSCD